MEGPLRATAGDCHEMALQGLPPGMFLCATYESLTLRLERGDSIAFFSDGLSDTKNHAEDFFGTERIRVVQLDAAGHSAGTIERHYVRGKDPCRG